MSNLLEVNDFTLVFNNGYSEQEVIHGISFAVKKGEIVGLVGESGSGKTVTGLSILRLLSAENSTTTTRGISFQQGETSVDLSSISDSDIRMIRGKRIAMIFQEPMSAFNPVIRLGKQVTEVITTHTNLSHHDAKEVVLDLFEKVKIPDPARAYQSYVHELSGGQLQRIMIAMAISCKPDLIIADEPTTALDVTVQNDILDLLKSLNTEYGMSILMISHDLGVIANLCDRVIVMRNGNIIEEGSVSDIFNNPKERYTKGLLACRPTLKTSGQRLPELSEFLNPDESSKLRKPTIKHTIGTETVLSALGIVKTYTSSNGWFKPKKITTAVDHVNLSIHSGEILGLVGESGCGKTSLSNILLGLDSPDSGEVYYNGRALASFTKTDWKAYRKDVQVIFQNPYSALNPRMSIGRAIEEPMLVHSLHNSKQERKEKVIQLLIKVGLEAEHYDRMPDQFSGGQRQRIVIARALAVQPKLIICDECVSALDVSIQASIINLLLDLRDEFDMSYLFISHDLRVVKFVSDNILVMQSGQIVEQGSKSEIFNNPKSEYTKQLLASVPTI